MDINYIFKVLILALCSGGATFFGVLIGRKFNRAQGLVFGTSFAAGIMVLIAVFELIPTAVKESNILKTTIATAAGVLVIFIVNKIIPHVHSVKDIENCDDRYLIKLSYLLTIGLILHDFPEGFAIPSSFGYSASLGLLVVVATFIHNIPEGYALTVASDKYKSRGFYYRSALFSTLSTFGGAIMGLILLNYFQALNPIFMVVAAGAMLYISLHELLPVAKKYQSGFNLYKGLALSILVYILLQVIF